MQNTIEKMNITIKQLVMFLTDNNYVNMVVNGNDTINNSDARKLLIEQTNQNLQIDAYFHTSFYKQIIGFTTEKYISITL